MSRKWRWQRWWESWRVRCRSGLSIHTSPGLFVSWKRQNTLQSANHKHFCWASSYDKTAIFFIRYYFSYFINSREAAKAVFRIHSFGVINCVSAINKGRERRLPWHYRQLQKVAIPSNGDCMTAWLISDIISPQTIIVNVWIPTVVAMSHVSSLHLL